MISEITLWVVLILLSISTVVTLADALGFTPQRLSKWLNRNRVNTIVEILKEFGIDIERYKRTNLALGLKSYFDSKELVSSLEKNLDDITLKGDFIVGKTESASSKAFINLMGATTAPEKAKLYARYLSTYWKELILKDTVKSSDFDLIITPKSGSPILGYEFSQIFEKPFMLHCKEAKFDSATFNMHKHFDFCALPAENSIALLVDDSTTGGRKVLETINDLRNNGFIVKDCLVVFEPTIKNARKNLEDVGVTLHSITKRP